MDSKETQLSRCVLGGGGLIIDPSRTKSIRVDPAWRVWRVQPDGRTETAYFYRDLQYDLIILYG